MYKVLLLPQAQRDLDNLYGKTFQQIKKRLHSLSVDPRPRGSLKLTAEDGYRLRAGDYRIIYRVNDKEQIVYIYRVKHRKAAYK